MSQWNSLSDFLAMGGYGFYVWGSYLVTAVFVVGEILLVRKRHSDIRRQISRMARLNDKVDEA